MFEKLRAIFYCNRRNKRLQCYDRWEKFVHQLVKNNLRTYVNIQKIVTGQEDDYTTVCLLGYPYFE